jgi:hypothetical protein
MAKARQQKMQYQLGSMAAIQQLENRSDDQLLRETKHRAAARALLGARAAERYDAKTARSYFNEAMASCHPQERPGLRRMMKASMALAERRPDELKQAVEALGQTPPSRQQLLLLRLTGLIAPPSGASIWQRARGILVLLVVVTVLLALGLGITELGALPFGGINIGGALLVGSLIVAAVLGVVTLVGRKRQAKARARGSSS